MKKALISVSNKENLKEIAKFLLENDYQIYSTGGTFKKLIEDFSNYENEIIKISDYTGFPEILDGRVKTLNPKIYGGILADLSKQSHLDQLNQHQIHPISVVIVNLYPFYQNNCIENIDIGGVSLIRASAKNYENVSILTNPKHYKKFIDNFDNLSLQIKKEWARDAFLHTTNYDNAIYNYFDETNISLKYGMNPHQSLSSVNHNGAFELINGKLGYINVMDFIHGWLMTYEIFKLTNKTTFISMKHTSPAGLGIGTNISEDSLTVFGISDEIRDNLSAGAIAFIKSRNCDPLSSFGDFICSSCKVDKVTANLIKREVCDGIVAPDYEPEALEILRSKKSGNFIVLKSNCEYFDTMHKDGWVEERKIFGMTLRQPFNSFTLNTEDIELKQYDYDAIIAYTILKYSQSNNISLVYNGQLLGLGCGQQNRVGCVKLAGDKSMIWRLRHHQDTIAYFLELCENKNFKRQDRVNLVYEYIEENKEKLMKSLKNLPITLGSDGFFPFPDNIVEANKYGVTRILQPGGSIADTAVSDKCKELNIDMFSVGARMFYH